MANKYNIYRIPYVNKEGLITKLENVGLEEAGNIESGEYQMSFYYSSQPDEIDIWWTELYTDFLGNPEEIPKNQMYFGTLLIFNESSQICYAISLGKSHFYLRQFCDTEFGMKLAERIVDEQNLKIKNSKYYKSQKNQSITSYQSETIFTYDTGESMHYIKAATINEELWGKVASFGTSVQLKLEISPIQLPEKIFQIESKLLEPPIIQIPKADLIKDDQLIQTLDDRLTNAILQVQEEADIETQEFTVSGIDFIFSDGSQYRYYQKNSQGQTISTFIELSLDSLAEYMTHQNLTDVNEVMVKVDREEGRGFSKPVRSILDYVDTDRYCLIDGKWHKFNKSYIEFLEREVELIDCHFKPEFNITSGISENTFNNNRAQHDDYINLDKDLVVLANRFKVEKMDLYKDETLFFVKKGTPQKLGYVIDQAINTILLLKNNESKIEIEDNQSISVQKICLWIIVKRVTDLNRLSDINSIIFLMKLTDWRKKALDSGFTPIVYVSYIRN
ncbi:DUF6119 family protein [uncultured Aquimarina sp.]|uniref:DUF6119 family protein n=1 Tax=uncultured Aquimarina sp. TaxID=575652 RepID=UPI00263372E9|nr:DUF6119 family protein [uncultured Aquimarina sp.]